MLKPKFTMKRLNSMSWLYRCLCTHCQIMDREEESVCCQEVLACVSKNEEVAYVEQIAIPACKMFLLHHLASRQLYRVFNQHKKCMVSMSVHPLYYIATIFLFIPASSFVCLLSFDRSWAFFIILCHIYVIKNRFLDSISKWYAEHSNIYKKFAQFERMLPLLSTFKLVLLGKGLAT